MKQFEYKKIDSNFSKELKGDYSFYFEYKSKSDLREKYDNLLNELGLDGWEIISEESSHSEYCGNYEAPEKEWVSTIYLKYKITAKRCLKK